MWLQKKQHLSQNEMDWNELYSNERTSDGMSILIYNLE